MNNGWWTFLVIVFFLTPPTEAFSRWFWRRIGLYNGHQILKKVPEHGYNLVYNGFCIKQEVTDQAVYNAWIEKRHNEIVADLEMSDL